MANQGEQSIVYGEPRHAWLDWMRGVSILLVLLSHYQVPWSQAGLFEPLAMADMRFGWSGVDFFFIISGFLIGNLLLREIITFDKLDASRFYFRRILKIWPLYYLCCLTFVLILPVLGLGSMQKAVTLITPALFHVQNYVQPAPLGHLWSLAVEEHFYLLLPIVMTICLRVSKPEAFARNMLWILLTGITLACFSRAFSAIHFHLGGMAVRGFTHFRIDTLFIGVTLAWIYQYRPMIWRRALESNRWLFVPACAGAITFAFNPNNSIFVASFGYSLLAIMYSGILLYFSRYEILVPSHSMKSILQIFAWIGRYSYPIYLFHPFIWVAIAPRILPIFAYSGIGLRSLLWPIGLIIFLSSAILIGAGVGRLLETPLLRLRNHLIPPKILAFAPQSVNHERERSSLDRLPVSARL